MNEAVKQYLGKLVARARTAYSSGKPALYFPTDEEVWGE